MRRRIDVLWQRVGEETVGLDLRNSRYFSLNETGALMWERIQSDDTVEGGELASLLVETYGIGSERAEADAAAFVEDLAAHGLVDP